MTVDAKRIFRSLQDHRAALWLDGGDRLVIVGRDDALPDALLAEVRERHEALRACMLALRQALPDPETLHALPVDRRRRPDATQGKGMVVTRLDGRTVAALAELFPQRAHAPGEAFAQVLARLFAAFVSRCSSETSIAIGTWTPAAAELRCLRCELDGARPVSSLLADQDGVRAIDLSGLEHDWIALHATPYHPCFQLMLTFEGDAALIGPGQYPGRERLDLNLHVRHDAEGCDLGWEYAVALFGEAGVLRLADNFATFLRSALATPDLPVQALQMRGPRELALFREMAQTREPFDDPSTIHALFERQAASTPDAIAIRHGDASVTYAELDRAASRLAAHLRGFGVGADGFIGIHLRRTPALPCSILAVLKSGAAYLPLDPNYPADRLQYLLQDTGASTIVTEAVHADRFRDAGRHLFVWEEDAVLTLRSPTLDGLVDPSPLPAVSHRQLAYAIYTSGSTGQPKGVMIEHRNAVSFLRWALGIFPEAVLRNVLASTSINFDLSVYELFAPLSCGGSLSLVDSLLDLIAAPERYCDLTLINSVPSAVNELVLCGTIPPSVRVVNLAGEPLRRALVDAIYANSRVEAVYNLYGPSEDTTYSTFSLVERDSDEEPSIGVPLAHTQAYILDERMEPVPMGVVGELYLGGAGLSRGYLNKDELTRRVFLPNPFHAPGDPGIYARLYKTGDRARWSASRCIEYMGRVDHQVKIRGFRIELGEIEAHLLKLAQVRECVVVVHRIDDGDQRIVAYLAPTEPVEDAVALSRGLKAELARFLPGYMLPSSFMVLPALPLLPNGKVDRKALPAPVYGGEGGANSARTAAEEALGELWRTVLKLSVPPAAQDDFFELGGHSLLLTKLINAIDQRNGVRLSFAQAYSHPTLGAMADLVERSPARPPAPAPIPIADGPTDAGAPLTFPQQQLWFLDQLQGGSPQYHLQLNFRIEGALDPAALERACARLLQRHEALRTRYAEVDGEPRQFVDDAAAVPVRHCDLSQAAPDERRDALLRILETALAAPMALDAAPLLRVVLVSLEADVHHLLLVVHHIAADGWSLELIKRDLSACHAIECGRTPPAPLPMPGIRFAAHAARERQRPAGAHDADLAYWKRQLADLPATHGLPLDRPRPAVLRHAGAVWRQFIPDERLAGLRRVCVEAHATLFAGLHALVLSLVHRVGGDRDVVLGTPVAGRVDEALADVCGFFVNTLPLRCRIDEGDAYVDLLRRCRETLIDAFDHQGVSFAQITEAVAPQRSLAMSPVFQIMLSLQNNDRHALSLAGAEVEEVPAPVFNTSMFDLLIDVAESGDGAHLAWEYSTELFDAATIEGFGRTFEALLAGVAANPAVPVADIPLPDSAEQAALLSALNDTHVRLDGAALLHEGFVRQAARTPSAVAVECGAARLSYLQLEQASNRVANLLVSSGVQPGQRVGLLVRRSLDMLAGLLGLLKAGATHVPLDPKYPAARLRELIEDSAVARVIAHRSLLDALPVDPSCCLCIDDTAQDHRDGELRIAADQPEAAPPVVVDPADLAYLIYTSGSTGRPKGVMIEHRNAASFLDWATKAFDAEQLSAVLACTSICFDLSVFEIFAPLHAGGRVVLVDSALDLIDAAPGPDVSLINCVPSAIAELLDHGAIPGTVRTINLAGEPLRRRLADRLYALPHVEAVYNLYGPSEDTTYSTCYLVPREEDAEPAIGRPIANTRAYVLDGRMNPCPVGAVGELYLGGAGLARGYLDQPEQTARVFIDNPMLAREGHGDIDGYYRRLYRTGDLARLRADGQLEFLGRADQQVKLRGFRIEPGEIEAAMLRHPAITQAVVAVEASADGEQRLVAYATHDPAVLAPEALDGALRRHLQACLPHFMVPSVVVPLQTMPLTPNGKIDRKALPSPDAIRSSGGRAPATALEQRLASLWRDVLKREGEIRADDNFFALGGHSLLLTRLVNAVSQAFDARLSMKDVYESADLSAMARSIEDAIARAGIAQAVDRAVDRTVDRTPDDAADRAVDRTVDSPLSYSQLRVWFVEQLDPGTNQNNIQVGARLEGELALAHLQSSLDAIVAGNDAFRLHAVAVAGEPRQRLAPALETPIRYHDATSGTDDPEAHADRLLHAHGTRVFDLFAPPLFSVMLVKTAPQRHRLNVVFHHLVFDGISFNAFLAEWFARYSDLCAGRAHVGESRPYDFLEHVHWQRQWLRGDQARLQEAFWADYLERDSKRIRFGVPGDDGARQSTALVRLPVEAALRERLGQASRRCRGTAFNLMHAAFCVLLSRLSGNVRVCTGIPVAGRTLAHADRIYGNFLNNLPLAFDVDLSESFEACLGRHVAEMSRVLAHQELPFERILELGPRRRDDAGPWFNVFFNMLDDDAEPPALAGLAYALDDVGIVDSKFDMTLYVIGDGDGWDLQCHFRTGFATRETIERMLAQYERFLRQLAWVVDRPCGAYALDGTAEGEAQGEVASLPAVRRFWSGSVHAWFERRVEADPDRIAIIEPTGATSYGRLHARSARLAARLSDAGIARGARVAVIATRSSHLVAAMFATHRLGAGFSLINPDQPVDRIMQLFDVLDPAACVFCGSPDAFDAALVAQAASRVPVVYAAGPDPAEGEGAGFPAPVDADPQEVACITFTSGTSGIPKAVLGTHLGLSGYLDWWPQRMGVGQDDRYSLLSGLSHDPIQRDVFGALCTGACLVVPDEAELVPGRLARWFARHEVSVAHLTPAMSQILCDSGDALPALKLVFLTGEKLHASRVHALRRLNPDVVVLNSYGTTETQRGSTYCVASALGDDVGTVPVGRATPDTRLRILNDAGHDCAIGEVGEIFVESHHLSNGYLGDPALTERVLSIRADGLKRYRTGDHGCLLSPDMVRCLGRRDRQINIRGYRADPSEIESACRREPRVKDAVVVAVPAPAADQDASLVAYVVGADPGQALEAAVMACLVQALPSYLVPAAVVSLSALPLTRNGKLDEARLPPPPLPSVAVHAAPEGPIERRLQRIWEDLLGCEGIGAEHGFFALGGHSLAAIRLCGAVWSAFGVSLPLKTVFERPTIRAIAAWIAANGGAEASPPVRPRRSGQRRAPLSFAQQRIHFLSQFPEQRPAFNLPRAFRIEGVPDLDALERALDALLRRHAALRTVFVMRDDDVMQEVADPPRLRLARIDLRAERPAGLRERLDAIIEAEACAPFDLERDPLLRATLVALDDATHVLLLTMHHIASDGWSNGLLLDDLGRLYADARIEPGEPGDDAPDGDAPLAYIDHALEQRARHDAGATAPALAYWREQLAGAPASHSLPLDRERPVRQSIQGAHLETRIDADILHGLKRVCADADATLFGALGTAWSIVMARYGGVDDVVFGTPVAGRDAATERTVGCFINTLPLRFRPDPDEAFSACLRRTRDTLLDAFDHADVPFELLVEALAPERTSSHPPLFQVMLALQNYAVRDLELPGLRCTPEDQRYPCSKLDLSLYCREREDGIDILWEYAVALFDPGTIEGMARAFRAVLAGIVADPHGAVGRLPLVEAAQQQALLALCEGPRLALQDACVPTLFKAQCLRTPDAIAVRDRDGVLDYAGLEARADAIAHALRDCGAGEGARIGVCLERGSDLLATLLGVFKAGCAYVPLDPQQPLARLLQMVEQAGATWIVTERRHAQGFAGDDRPGDRATDCLVIDDPDVAASLARAARTRPEAHLPPPDPDRLAYVIFTSGSTGKPKGVAIGHRALANLLLTMRDAPGFGPGKRLLAVTSIGFDIAALELFLPIVAGGEVHVADAATCRDAVAIGRWLDAHGITTMQATPSLWQLLLDSGELDGRMGGLEVLVGGEMLGEALMSRLSARAEAVWNLYGPTETTIWSTRWRCRADQRVTIGWPIANTECYVLSGERQLQPPGAIGELYIGGSGLAEGYYGQPELTAHAFVPHPFREGERLYRTGDLCRQAEDGRLQCLGRRDHQIKIRGFRVELGEIEAALLRCADVASAVVALDATEAGAARIVAYLVHADPAFNAALAAGEASAEALAQDERAVLDALRRALPDYMVPSAMLFLPRMPLNANGKVDRGALPRIGAATRVRERVPPSTPIEEAVAALWAECLGVPEPAATDNFFEAGGHSILAMKLLSRVNRRHGLSIPLADFLDAPTIRALAAQIGVLDDLRGARDAGGERGGGAASRQELII